MEVVIRLQKAGKTSNKRYNYRIVAMPKKTARQANSLDILGYYDPAKKPMLLSVNVDKINTWVSKGARLSDTVKSLVKKAKKS